MTYPVANFRPTEKNKNRLNMAKTLRLNMSEIINDILDQHLDAEIKKRVARLQKEMERAKGFESWLKNVIILQIT
jgi:ABC-type ATPase with predicted acetyltransferase domain